CARSVTYYYGSTSYTDQPSDYW
nr:immunoglobulin heavy chain junction region [Macaca mulatta]MOV87144.1 immunoglobulin heavy chain junction region [Macaca mulatta]MOV88130.1 immunoglobulin heavy chain junction region [Macaca mulatta]MOV88146.1 immunoglobulin heavy chain junction region [Macaca mulatta]MOV88335.1 immunoglobulin heavy chain junction region [Macaca mulatta]